MISEAGGNGQPPPTSAGALAFQHVLHEDGQLATRLAALLTATAFLALSYATVEVWRGPLGGSGVLFQYLVIALGLVLSYFFMGLGHRSKTAIQFWRSYMEASGRPDAKMFNFFRGGAIDESEFRIVHSKPAKDGTPSVWFSKPWERLGSPNNLLGVVLPVCLAAFWDILGFLVPVETSISICSTPIPVQLVLGVVISILTIAIFWQMIRSWPGGVIVQEPTALLAVLGRGIQLNEEGTWVPSPLKEVCRIDSGNNNKPSHSPTVVPLPAQGERGAGLRLGGGVVNVAAAAVLLQRAAIGGATIDCVLGYAPPAKYLEGTKGCPASEGVPMETALRKILGSRSPDLSVDVIPFSGESRGESTTEAEVANVFQLAMQRGYARIKFLTVSPHVPRVAFVAAEQSFSLTKGRGGPSFAVVSSDEVLLGLSAKEWPVEAFSRNELMSFRNSAAYRSTIHDENCGLFKLQMKGGPKPVSVASTPSSPAGNPKGQPGL